MRTRRIAAAVVAGMLAAGGIGACGEEDANDAADQVEDAGRDAGEAAEDAAGEAEDEAGEIKEDVERELEE
jgi:hypothetical protein